VIEHLRCCRCSWSVVAAGWSGWNVSVLHAYERFAGLLPWLWGGLGASGSSRRWIRVLGAGRRDLGYGSRSVEGPAPLGGSEGVVGGSAAGGLSVVG